MNQNVGGKRYAWFAVLFWALFGAGLLVQAFAPRLKIKNNAFVIPQSLVTEGKDIRPAALIAHERRMQLLSGILTLGGSLGLGFHYRRVLVRPRSPRRERILGGPRLPDWPPVASYSTGPARQLSRPSEQRLRGLTPKKEKQK